MLGFLFKVHEKNSSSSPFDVLADFRLDILPLGCVIHPRVCIFYLKYDALSSILISEYRPQKLWISEINNQLDRIFRRACCWIHYHRHKFIHCSPVDWATPVIMIPPDSSILTDEVSQLFLSDIVEASTGHSNEQYFVEDIAHNTKIGLFTRLVVQAPLVTKCPLGRHLQTCKCNSWRQDIMRVAWLLLADSILMFSCLPSNKRNNHHTTMSINLPHITLEKLLTISEFMLSLGNENNYHDLWDDSP